MNVLQQPDGNAVAIADAVNREFQRIKKELPPDVNLAIFYDQSILIRDSIGSVAESILIGLGLSIALLVGFLKSWRTAFVAALATAEPNFGDFLVKLKRKCDQSAEEAIHRFRRKIAETVPVLRIEFAHILEDLIADLVASPQPIEIKVFHPNDATYKAVARDIAAWLPKVPGVVDIVNRTIIIGPARNFRVNPEKAALAGFSVQDV